MIKIKPPLTSYNYCYKFGRQISRLEETFKHVLFHDHFTQQLVWQAPWCSGTTQFFWLLAAFHPVAVPCFACLATPQFLADAVMPPWQSPHISLCSSARSPWDTVSLCPGTSTAQPCSLPLKSLFHSYMFTCYSIYVCTVLWGWNFLRVIFAIVSSEPRIWQA